MSFALYCERPELVLHSFYCNFSNFDSSKCLLILFYPMFGMDEMDTKLLNSTLVIGTLGNWIRIFG